MDNFHGEGIDGNDIYPNMWGYSTGSAPWGGEAPNPADYEALISKFDETITHDEADVPTMYKDYARNVIKDRTPDQDMYYDNDFPDNSEYSKWRINYQYYGSKTGKEEPSHPEFMPFAPEVDDDRIFMSDLRQESAYRHKFANFGHADNDQGISEEGVHSGILQNKYKKGLTDYMAKTLRVFGHTFEYLLPTPIYGKPKNNRDTRLRNMTAVGEYTIYDQGKNPIYEKEVLAYKNRPPVNWGHLISNELHGGAKWTRHKIGDDLVDVANYGVNKSAFPARLYKPDCSRRKIDNSAQKRTMAQGATLGEKGHFNGAKNSLGHYMRRAAQMRQNGRNSQVSGREFAGLDVMNKPANGRDNIWRDDPRKLVRQIISDKEAMRELSLGDTMKLKKLARDLNRAKAIGNYRPDANARKQGREESLGHLELLGRMQKLAGVYHLGNAERNGGMVGANKHKSEDNLGAGLPNDGARPRRLKGREFWRKKSLGQDRLEAERGAELVNYLAYKPQIRRQKKREDLARNRRHNMPDETGGLAWGQKNIRNKLPEPGQDEGKRRVVNEEKRDIEYLGRQIRQRAYVNKSKTALAGTVESPGTELEEY